MQVQHVLHPRTPRSLGIHHFQGLSSLGVSGPSPGRCSVKLSANAVPIVDEDDQVRDPCLTNWLALLARPRSVIDGPQVLPPRLPRSGDVAALTTPEAPEPDRNGFTVRTDAFLAWTIPTFPSPPSLDGSWSANDWPPQPNIAQSLVGLNPQNRRIRRAALGLNHGREPYTRLTDQAGAIAAGLERMSRALAKRTTLMSLFRTNVRLSVQRKCHSVMPRWYQMMTPWEPPGIVALEDPRHPGNSSRWPG